MVCRQIIRILMIIVPLAALAGCTASGVAGTTGLAGTDLFQVRDGHTMRVSSSDPNWQNGNADHRAIKPGDTLTIADIDGPGVIRHIWFTINAEDPRYPRSLTLRMYWDNQTEPAVESPIGDFFAVGHGLQRYVDSMPVSVTSEGRALNCYWPMPFAKHARITLTNDSKTCKARSIYFYVDYEKVPALPANTANFHAQYRQEFPAKMGQNYLLLDAEGQGQYVGTVLSVITRTKGWFGEGDDFFYIDGESEPSLRGTGTEDYFCDGWGFREFARPYYGVVVQDGYEVGDRISVYRWHVKDPVRFSKSLKVEIEHKGQMDDSTGKNISGFMERPDLFSSVAFWYQTGKAKRFATVPPAEERVVPQTVVECETAIKTTKAEPAAAAVEVKRGPFSGGNALLVKVNSPSATVTIPFKLEAATQGVARLRFGTLPAGGIWSVSTRRQVDRKPLRGRSLFGVHHRGPHVRSSRGPGRSVRERTHIVIRVQGTQSGRSIELAVRRRPGDRSDRAVRRVDRQEVKQVGLANGRGYSAVTIHRRQVLRAGRPFAFDPGTTRPRLTGLALSGVHPRCEHIAD